MIDRRKSRLDLRKFKVDTNIVGRPYQLEAIQRVAEAMVTDEASTSSLRHFDKLNVSQTQGASTV